MIGSSKVTSSLSVIIDYGTNGQSDVNKFRPHVDGFTREFVPVLGVLLTVAMIDLQLLFFS